MDDTNQPSGRLKAHGATDVRPLFQRLRQGPITDSATHRLLWDCLRSLFLDYPGEGDATEDLPTSYYFFCRRDES